MDIYRGFVPLCDSGFTGFGVNIAVRACCGCRFEWNNRYLKAMFAVDVSLPRWASLTPDPAKATCIERHRTVVPADFLWVHPVFLLWVRFLFQSRLTYSVGSLILTLAFFQTYNIPVGRPGLGIDD